MNHESFEKSDLSAAQQSAAVLSVDFASANHIEMRPILADSSNIASKFGSTPIGDIAKLTKSFRYLEVSVKSYSSLLLSLVILLGVGVASPTLAQIELNTGDGNRVKVGPEGVFIQSGNNTVKVRSAKVRSANVKAGHANVKTTKTVTHVSRRDLGASRATVVKQTTVNTTVGTSRAQVVKQTTVNTTSGASRAQVVKQTMVNTTVIPGTLTKNKKFMVLSNNTEATYVCNGDSCTIVSNNCTIRLNGNCCELSVTGNNNDVICTTVAAISIAGNNNTVTWKAGAKQPSMSVLGNNNETREDDSN